MEWVTNLNLKKLNEIKMNGINEQMNEWMNINNKK